MINIIAQGFQREGAMFMWAILIFAGLALALVIERVYYIYFKCSMGRADFMMNIARLLQAGKVDEAGKHAASRTIPLAGVISAVLNSKESGETAVDKAVDEVYLTEAPRINRYLNLLMTVANLATLGGLLGTIYGLIVAFNAVANLPAAERPQALADGISIAMGTTFFGLTVAIPTIFMHGLLSSQSERLIEEMEEKAVKVMNLL
ncbi:MotA/TolQ/ExbB proton channel family protein [Fibrobacterota bacterium]